MSDKPLRVGIIGASATGGWARESHVPAVQQLPGVTLTAVANSSQQSADAAAKAFGAPAAYGNPADLFRDPNVDVVTVAVKVPDHRALVLGALAAGKAVFCEWPLGRDLAEAEELAEAAQAAGVLAAIGLQARLNPAAQRARELLTAGTLGRVLSARLYSATVAFGPEMPASGAYLEQAANGATLVSIHGGHALDLAIMQLGGLADAAGLETTQYPAIHLGGAPHARAIADHLLVQSRLGGGGALTVEVAGGRPSGSPFELEIIGENGTLALAGRADRGFQSGRLRLLRNRRAAGRGRRRAEYPARRGRERRGASTRPCATTCGGAPAPRPTLPTPCA
ncbi:MAG: Gfo/Idh/MocA family oxidoreductase [Hymenobacter sp.]